MLLQAGSFLPQHKSSIDASLPFVLDASLQAPPHGITPEVKVETAPGRVATGSTHSPVVLSDAGGGSTNGLDQLIETFTSTGLLQRSLDEDELEIVSQQIQLQMQQTQLQMLQLALRQQQLQAAQMQLKLQHQSIIVHRRQHPTSQPMTSPDTVVASTSNDTSKCSAVDSQHVETTVQQEEPRTDSCNVRQNSPALIFINELQTPSQQSQSNNQNWQTGSDVTMPRPALDTRQPPCSSDVNALNTSRPLSSRRSPSASLEDIERFAKVFKRRRIALGFTQCDVGLTMGKLYGNDFSQTTISRFEALNLSFKNMCKLKPLLEKWLDDVGHRGNSSNTTTAAATYHLQHQQLQHPPSQDQQYNHHSVHHHVPQQEQSYQRTGISNPPPPPMASSDGLMRLFHCSDTVSMIADSLQTARRRKKRTNIDQTVRHALENFFRRVPKPTAEQIGEVAERLGMDRDVVHVWFCNRRQKEKRVHPGGSIGLNKVHHHHQQQHQQHQQHPQHPHPNGHAEGHS